MLQRILMSDLAFYCIFTGTVAITVLWWWVQRPLLARKWVYAVTLGTIVAAGMAAYFLPPVLAGNALRRSAAGNMHDKRILVDAGHRRGE